MDADSQSIGPGTLAAAKWSLTDLDEEGECARVEHCPNMP
jgi:hypothetical protein